MDKQSSPAPFSDSFLNLYNGWRLLASFSKTIHALVFVIIRTLWQPAKLSSRVEHSKFSSLPPELMEAVLRELEWNDVLHARVTCRSLYVASKGLVIWRRLFHRLSDSYAAPIFPPKPLEAYTAHELENLVTRWLRADSLWSPSVPRDPPAFRHVRQASALSYVVLVEGGRWLLTSDECDKGAICFHLLDSLDSQIGPTVLIKDPDEAFMTSMHAIVDHSSPTLTFDLAVVYDDRVGATVHGRVEIWRVIETEDATLSPTRITEFITPIPDEVELHTSLLGPLFARFDGYNYIEIYDWTKSRANTHCKCVIRATCRGNDVVEMKLLPGRKMLLIGQKTFSVISIPDLSTYSAEHTMPAPHEPTPLFHWEVDGLVVRDNVSTSIGPADNTYVAVATSQGIYHIHIHQDKALLTRSLQIELDILFPFPLGAHRAIMNRGDGDSLAAMSLFKEATIKRYCTDGLYEAYGAQPAMDEWSGRAVLYLSNGWISVVEG